MKRFLIFFLFPLFGHAQFSVDTLALAPVGDSSIFFQWPGDSSIYYTGSSYDTFYRYNINSKVNTLLGASGKSLSVRVYNDSIAYIGGYPDGSLYEYNKNRPWGTNNPKIIGLWKNTAGFLYTQRLVKNDSFVVGAGNSLGSSSIGAYNIFSKEQTGYSIDKIQGLFFRDLAVWNDKVIFSTSDYFGGDAQLYIYQPSTNTMVDSINVGFNDYGKIIVIGQQLIGIAHDKIYKLNLTTKTVLENLVYADSSISYSEILSDGRILIKSNNPLPGSLLSLRVTDNFSSFFQLNNTAYAVYQGKLLKINLAITGNLTTPVERERYLRELLNTGVSPQPPPPNAAPSVNASADQSITLGTPLSLSATITDDALPDPPASVSVVWSKISGPGLVIFTDSTLASTSVTFSAPGVYVLRCTAFDGELSSSDDVSVTVIQANTAPVVNAGQDQAILANGTATLAGTVTDDGLPSGTLVIQWSTIEGPGTVTFGNSAITVTTATFSVKGIYTLRLTASDGALTSSDDIVITVNAVNTAPVVNAGNDKSIIITNAANLSGTVTDDGLPNPPAATTKIWSKVSGPGTVTFGNSNLTATTARFSAVGTYVLRLNANDGELSGSDDIKVTVKNVPPVNTPPVVNAGGDQSIIFGNTVSLSGTVTDDGLPNPPAATTKIWSKVGGSGTVTFGSSTSLVTTATFSAVGIYTLRLTANDGELASTDDIVITVTAINTAPSVNAGNDQSITLGTSTTLSGTVTDDGLPNPPGATTQTWSKFSGPGTVTFGSANSLVTSASFSLTGTYVVRLTANDGALTSTDDVTVTVIAQNVAPTVNAGIDQTISIGTSASLSGSVSDDGLPNPPGTTTKLWTKASGPGIVTFSDHTSLITTASFSLKGTYTLQLSANDGALTSSDNIAITVIAQNTAPSVNAGSDQSITLGNTTTLTASVIDDGLPNPPGTTTKTWSKLSGPGTVTFGSPNSITTTASFSVIGTYGIRITASDGALTSYDDAFVTVTNPVTVNKLGGIWGIGEINNLTLFNQVKAHLSGFLLRLTWTKYETSPGVFNHAYVEDQVRIAVDAGLKVAILINISPSDDDAVASTTPPWVFVSPYSVPRVETNEGSSGKHFFYPYYLDSLFRARRINKEDVLINRIRDTWSTEWKNALVLIQSAEGSTGDADPYHGDVIAVKINNIPQSNISIYTIDKDRWTTDKRTNVWPRLFNKMATDMPAVKLLINPDDRGIDWAWAQTNLPNAGLKLLKPVRYYNYSGEYEQAAKGQSLWGTTLPSKIVRGELDMDVAGLPWYTTASRKNLSSAITGAINSGVNMFCMTLQVIASLIDVTNQNDFYFLDIGQALLPVRSVSEAYSGMVKLRDAIDPTNTARFPETGSVNYGPVIDPARKNNYDNQVNVVNNSSDPQEVKADQLTKITINNLNDGRRVLLQKKFPQAKLFPPEPVNPDGYNNDYVVHAIPDNYNRFITQWSPNTTSKGYWRIGGTDEAFGRSCRAFDVNTGKTEMFFTIDPGLISNSIFSVKFDVWYRDEGTKQWSLNYWNGTAKTNAGTITCTGTNKWVKHTFNISDFWGGAHLEHGTDFTLKAENNTNVKFDFVYLVRIII